MPEDGASISAAMGAGCQDCEWFQTMISRARGACDDRGAADLEALQGRHLHLKYNPDTRPGLRGLPGGV